MKQQLFSTLACATLIFSTAACGNHVQMPDDSGQEDVVETTVDDQQQIDAAADYIDSLELKAAPVTRTVAHTLDDKYSYVDPQNLVPTKLLASALAYFDTNQSKIKNKNYLSVVDFSAYAGKARFFIINMKTGAVQAFHVAHGSGSDVANDGYAEKFSNVSGSNASSLGFYMTAETYSGKHGYSLRLDGLSSTNSKVRARAVVIHGASYVSDSNIKAGRSWGCLAVSMASRTKVIDMLKGGSVIYAGLSK